MEKLLAFREGVGMRWPLALRRAAAAANRERDTNDTIEMDTIQMDTIEVDTIEVDTIEVDTIEVDTIEVDTIEVDTIEVDRVEMDTRHSTPPRQRDVDNTVRAATASKQQH